MKRILLPLFLLILLCGCGKTNEYSTDFFAMDTFMSIKAYGKEAQQAAEAAEHSVTELENLISRTRETSDIYKLNHANGAVVTVDAETYKLLQTVRALAVPGTFDVTIASLSDLWGIGTDHAHIPSKAEIESARETISYENLQLLGGNTVQLLNNAKIDLGAIGKGIAADQCAQIMGQYEVSGALIALGGNIYTFGENPHKKSWTVGIANPDDSENYIGIIAVNDASVVTTGDYERFFEENGKRYHHVFDPETGYPSDSGLRSVTVVNSSSTLADARSTTLFVLGLEKGMQYCEDNDLDAIFVTTDNQIYVTQNLKAQFTFSGEKAGYTYVP